MLFRSHEEHPQYQIVKNACMKILNSEVTCDEISVLGKPKLHEELNIQVLPILFGDHKNDMDDMHKVVRIGVASV